jgi:hypothetical protein
MSISLEVYTGRLGAVMADHGFITSWGCLYPQPLRRMMATAPGRTPILCRVRGQVDGFRQTGRAMVGGLQVTGGDR